MAVPTAASFTAPTVESIETFLTDLQSHAIDNIRVYEHLTAFQEATQKESYLLSIIDEGTAKEDGRRCTTVFAAAKALLASGGFALMASDTHGAARSTGETYPWHCVCVLRVGAILWVYDPAFDPAAMPLKQRIGQVPRLSMTKALWTYFDKHGIIIRGMRIIGAADVEDRCVSLSCLWMEQMVMAERAQWPSLENCAAWRELTNDEWREFRIRSR